MSRADAFHAHFGQIYGDRWDILSTKLKDIRNYAALINVYALPSDVEDILCLKTTAFVKFPLYSPVALIPPALLEEFPFPKPSFDNNQRKSHYLMDPASLMVVEALNIVPGDKVLDLCAAPGGKSLAIAMKFANSDNISSTLYSNEIDPERKRRLQTVLDEYLKDLSHIDLQITHMDIPLGKTIDCFQPNKILIDAPCSSERHFMKQPSLLEKEWRLTKSPQAAKRQLKLLIAGLQLLSCQGRLVYATCSLSPLENDGVVKAALEKLPKGSGIQVVRKKWSIGEPTIFGWMVLPDHGPWFGSGPIYFSIFVKSVKEKN